MSLEALRKLRSRLSCRPNWNTEMVKCIDCGKDFSARTYKGTERKKMAKLCPSCGGKRGHGKRNKKGVSI